MIDALVLTSLHFSAKCPRPPVICAAIQRFPSNIINFDALSHLVDGDGRIAVQPGILGVDVVYIGTKTLNSLDESFVCRSRSKLQGLDH